MYLSFLTTVKPIRNGLMLAVFLGLGANMHVEFRMATIDPFGNCTNGIVRVYSPLTVNADNAIKHVSCWPSEHYLNIWVVKAIKSASTTQTTLGYAQFPFPLSGGSYSDGVLICSNYRFTLLRAPLPLPVACSQVM